MSAVAQFPVERIGLLQGLASRLEWPKAVYGPTGRLFSGCLVSLYAFTLAVLFVLHVAILD